MTRKRIIPEEEASISRMIRAARMVSGEVDGEDGTPATKEAIMADIQSRFPRMTPDEMSRYVEELLKHG